MTKLVSQPDGLHFPLVLFDADDTLFDFARCEKHSFTSVLAAHGIETCDDIYASYKAISAELWRRFERAEISKEDLRVGRFRTLLADYRMAADPHIVSQAYLDELKLQTFLIDGAAELCRALSAVCRIGIVTNGIEEVQRHRMARSAIASHIDFVVVSEECGYAKPHPAIFEVAMRKAGFTSADKVLMVGDRLEADIQGARAAGIKSCWYNPSGIKNIGGEITPDYEIKNLSSVLEIVGL